MTGERDLFGMTANLLKQEGAYLLAAEHAAETFNRRVLETPGIIKLSRSQALELAHMFARVVSIASGYHLDAAAQRKDAA